ncbi:glycosyltransferase family 9 protein [Pedobacter sp. SYSU D00535]|uniref:glycosyltransferase family 9 protein n=1 Tax=Pedobacter sp. SYSU D00535 TaxID=2810308 RepID=UPI001F605471|nr:glycosyltransferase family 9 protein [Pedobacter sp. SYSU D00535]
MLCTIPALKALRAAYPEAEITLLGLPWAETFVNRFNMYLDRFIWFPGFPGLPEQLFKPQTFCTFLKKMIQEEFDLVLQMQGNGNIVNPMVELFGAANVAGFFKEGVYVPGKCLFMPYPEKVHEIERHLQLMEFLGIPSLGKDLEFPLTVADEEDLKKAALPVEEGKYVCIHPGSRGASRQWDTDYFARLADIAIEKGFEAVITGTKEETDIARRVASKMKGKPIIASGKTSMGAVAMLLKNAGALVSNCTGVSHIAAALKTKSVVVSLDGEAHRWVPLNKEIHRSVDWTTNPDFELVQKEFLKVLN